MGKTRRGKRHNARYVAPVVVQNLSVPIFRFIAPEPDDEFTTNTQDSDTAYRSDGESVGTRRMASGAGKNLKFRGQREDADELIVKNERRLELLLRQLFALRPTSQARTIVRQEVSEVRDLLERLYANGHSR